MNYLLLFILFALIFSGCIKQEEVNERTSIIRGKVVENGTQKPLNGVLIKLKINRSGMSWGSPLHDSSSAISDNNGNYKLKYKPIATNYMPGDWFDFNFNRTNYINGQTSIQTINIPVDTVVNLILEPESFINLNVKNIIPAEDSDVIRLSYNLNGKGKGVKFDGKNVDTTYIIRTGGNKFQKFNIHLYKGTDLERYYMDSIYCPGFETVNFEIKY